MKTASAIAAFVGLFVMCCLGCPPAWAKPAKGGPIWTTQICSAAPVCGHYSCQRRCRPATARN